MPTLRRKRPRFCLAVALSVRICKGTAYTKKETRLSEGFPPNAEFYVRQAWSTIAGADYGARANHDHVFGVTERRNISPEDLSFADISQQPTAADTPEIDAPSVNISVLHNSQAHRHRHACLRMTQHQLITSRPPFLRQRQQSSRKILHQIPPERLLLAIEHDNKVVERDREAISRRSFAPDGLRVDEHCGIKMT